MIPAEAVEAAAFQLYRIDHYGTPDAWPTDEQLANGRSIFDPPPTLDEFKADYIRDAKDVLEAAAPYMLSHEREQTRLAHLDAMVNRETKREELAQAWDDGHLMGWNEATANTLPERDSLWRNPYRLNNEGEK